MVPLSKSPPQYPISWGMGLFKKTASLTLWINYNNNLRLWGAFNFSKCSSIYHPTLSSWQPGDAGGAGIIRASLQCKQSRLCTQRIWGPRMGRPASENPSPQTAPENPSHKEPFRSTMQIRFKKQITFGKITHWPVCNAGQNHRWASPESNF